MTYACGDDFVRLFYLHLARIKLKSRSDDVVKELESRGRRKRERNTKGQKLASLCLSMSIHISIHPPRS